MNLNVLQVMAILSVCFGGYSTAEIDFSDCGSDYHIKSVELEGCDCIPCKLMQGNSYAIVINLEPSYKSSHLTQKVEVDLGDVWYKLDVTPDNPCASLNCPVSAGASNTKLTGTITIGKNLLPTTGTLWWVMETETQRIALCMKTEVEIIRKPYKYKFSKLLLL